MDAVSRRFAWSYAFSQLKLKYRYTSLGFLWTFLEPALYLIVLSLIFSVVNRMNVHDYAVFLFGALVPWRYFERIVTTCMESIVGGDWLLKKMYVSPGAFPLSRWLTATIEFLTSLLVVLSLFLVIKQTWTVHLLVVPLAIVPWSLFGLGVGMVCAVLYAFFRDIRPLVQMVLMLAFFSSPILFKPELFDEHSFQAQIVRLHPVTYFAALFQKPIYYAAWPSETDWFISCLCAAAAVLAGAWMVHRSKGHFYFYL